MGEEQAGPALTVATVLYEGVDTLRVTLPKLIESCVKSEVPLVVIDNSVSDEPEQLWATVGGSQQGGRLVRRPDNPGFAASANEAIRLSSTQWVFLVNADVTVSSADIDKIKKHIAVKRTADPTAVSLVTDGIHTCGIEYARFGYFSDRRVEASHACLGPSGGAAIFSREQFLGFGGFRDDFFAWGEDADLAVRMWAAGVRTDELLLALPHIGGHSISGIETLRKKAHWLARNRILLMRSDYSVGAWLINGLPQLGIILLNGLRKTRQGTASAHFRGMAEGLLRKNHRVRNAERITVGEIRVYRRASKS